ncbi:MAG: AI-2E family transporter [bacterium]|nr:AI-2E family transporter [bacterium]
MWGVLFAVLFALRSFFLLIFLTFIFAYIQARMVNYLQDKIKSRSLRATLCALLLVGLIGLLGTFIAPKIKDEARSFAEKFPSYLQSIDQELIVLSEEHPWLKESFLPAQLLTGEEKPSEMIFQKFFQDQGKTEENLGYILNATKNIGSTLLAVTSAFLLSLLFSYLIVLDLPQLTESVRKLSKTKLQFIYNEVAESLRSFGVVMGKALEAQLMIALLNTVLTSIGLYLMGLHGKVVFLSLVVFLASFIPVAGVFISSIPICLVSLQEGGWSLALFAAGYIVLIHMIEAYILNPKIYGKHLHLNPVIVLIILTVAGKLFGIWGLVLGVPLCTYIFGHAIQYSSTNKSDKLQNVL